MRCVLHPSPDDSQCCRDAGSYGCAVTAIGAYCLRSPRPRDSWLPRWRRRRLRRLRRAVRRLLYGDLRSGSIGLTLMQDLAGSGSRSSTPARKPSGAA